MSIFTELGVRDGEDRAKEEVLYNLVACYVYAEKKITQRVLVQHAMHCHAFRAPLEIDSVILGPVTMKFFSLPLDHAEAAGIQVIEVFGKDLEFRQQLELQRLRQRRHFRGAQLVEDDLEHGVG